MKELVEEGLDWSYLIWMARSHEVLSLLSYRLEWACPHLVPELVLNQLRKHVRSVEETQLLLMTEVVRVLTFLENNQISAVPFLGPVLSQCMYQQLKLRPYPDIEFLLPKNQVCKGWEIMRERERLCVNV